MKSLQNFRLKYIFFVINKKFYNLFAINLPYTLPVGKLEQNPKLVVTILIANATIQLGDPQHAGGLLRCFYLIGHYDILLTHALCK